MDTILTITAIDRVVDLANQARRDPCIEVRGNTFVYSDARHEYILQTKTIQTLKTDSMQSIIDFLLSGELKNDLLFIHVVNEKDINLLSIVNAVTGHRDVYLNAESKFDAPRFFDEFWDLESFKIKLLTLCEQSEERDSLASDIVTIISDESQSITDTGVGIEVACKSGISLVGKKKLPQFVNLKPIRTFLEIDQVESQFLIRVKKEESGVKIGLMEYAKEMWKIEAKSRIKHWLKSELKDSKIR